MAKKPTHPKSSKKKLSPAPTQKRVDEAERAKFIQREPRAISATQTARNGLRASRSAEATGPLGARTSLPAEAAMSFLRDTKGSLNWSLRDLSQTLNISREEAQQVVTLLQIQGYVQPGANKSGEWITTPSGETVSGAKAPRFDRATVEKALASLEQRIEETNADRAAKYKIMRAVAFGDFLTKDRSRVQAAEVGVELARKGGESSSDDSSIIHSAAEAREEEKFLRQLRGRSAPIHLKPYSEWMGSRTHQKII